jgi:hypothetical protein
MQNSQLKRFGLTPIGPKMRNLAFIFSFFLLLPAVSYAADDLDQLLQTYAVKTKTLEGATATLVSDVQGSHNADEAATRIESYAVVYHYVAATFKDLMPAFLKAKTAGTLTTLERQSMIDSSQRMSEVGKVLTSESDAFDSALKPYQDAPRVSAAVTAFSNEGQALQAVAQQYNK